MVQDRWLIDSDMAADVADAFFRVISQDALSSGGIVISGDLAGVRAGEALALTKESVSSKLVAEAAAKMAAVVSKGVTSPYRCPGRNGQSPLDGGFSGSPAVCIGTCDGPGWRGRRGQRSMNVPHQKRPIITEYFTIVCSQSAILAILFVTSASHADSPPYLYTNCPPLKI